LSSPDGSRNSVVELHFEISYLTSSRFDLLEQRFDLTITFVQRVIVHHHRRTTLLLYYLLQLLLLLSTATNVICHLARPKCILGILLAAELQNDVTIVRRQIVRDDRHKVNPSVIGIRRHPHCCDFTHARFQRRGAAATCHKQSNDCRRDCGNTIVENRLKICTYKLHMLSHEQTPAFWRQSLAPSACCEKEWCLSPSPRQRCMERNSP